jgi:F420-non-reducing hydrogenase iron-sulfur subunit
MATRQRPVHTRSFVPKILVFSTNNISDPGIDLAGSSHLHYPPSVMTINVPCTSGIKPQWVLYAAQRGFDGVFIAADGEECAYRGDCAERSSQIVAAAQQLLERHGYQPRRLKMAAICSVCAEPFVNYMREFSEALVTLGPTTAGPGAPDGRPGMGEEP